MELTSFSKMLQALRQVDKLMAGDFISSDEHGMYHKIIEYLHDAKVKNPTIADMESAIGAKVGGLGLLLWHPKIDVLEERCAVYDPEFTRVLHDLSVEECRVAIIYGRFVYIDRAGNEYKPLNCKHYFVNKLA